MEFRKGEMFHGISIMDDKQVSRRIEIKRIK